jgi:PAS domain S-box-containing protein
MTPPRSVTDARVHAAAAALAATIFTADVLQPSAGLGVLHALVVMLGLRSRWKPFPAVAAAGVIALVWAAASISPAGLTMDGVTRAVVATALCVGAAWRVDTVRRLQRQTREHLTQLTNLKQALDHAAIVATTDVSGRITDVNEKFCRISGYAREELLGQDHRIINSAGHPKEFMRTLWHTIARGVARRDPQPRQGRTFLLGGHHHRAVPERAGEARAIHRDPRGRDRAQAGRGAAGAAGLARSCR